MHRYHVISDKGTWKVRSIPGSSPGFLTLSRPAEALREGRGPSTPSKIHWFDGFTSNPAMAGYGDFVEL